jgi:uncharacterized repeat protein (TIGR02543 family)
MSVTSTILSDLVCTVLVMSLSGGALALLLMFIKPLVRNHVPKSVQYGLWLVVLGALLVPVSTFIVLPERVVNMGLAPFHTIVEHRILTTSEERERAIPTATPGDVANPVPFAGLTDPAIPADAASSSVPVEPAASANLADQIGLAEPANSNDPASSPDAIDTAAVFGTVQPVHEPSLFARICTGFMLIYPFVVVLILFYNIVTYAYFMGKLRFRRIMLKSALAGVPELCFGKNPPPVYLCPLAATPMLVGLVRPMIILPDKEYTETELRSVLLHELIHLRRRDIVVKWLSFAACALHWFNPLVWLAKGEIDRACELSCDAAVIRDMNDNGRKNYGRTLIAMAVDFKVSRAVLSTTMCEEKKALKERLTSVAGYKQPRFVARMISALMLTAAVCVVGALGASAGSVAALPVHNTSADVPDVTIGVIFDEDAPAAEYSVTYNYAENGGVSATMTTATVADGMLADLTPTAWKAGWDFVGWNTDRNAKVALTSCPIQAADVTLYALYKKELTVTFCHFQGTEARIDELLPRTETTIYNNNASVTITLPAPGKYTRHTEYGDWTAIGWNRTLWTPDPNTMLVPTTSLVIDKNETFIGLYERNITLSFNTNGGSPVADITAKAYVNSVCGYIKTPVLTLPSAPGTPKPGCTFDKWVSNFGVLYDQGHVFATEYSGISASMSFTAVWKTVE